jgi:hypothetical protein
MNKWQVVIDGFLSQEMAESFTAAVSKGAEEAGITFTVKQAEEGGSNG